MVKDQRFNERLGYQNYPGRVVIDVQNGDDDFRGGVSLIRGGPISRRYFEIIGGFFLSIQIANRDDVRGWTGTGHDAKFAVFVTFDDAIVQVSPIPEINSRGDILHFKNLRHYQ